MVEDLSVVGALCQSMEPHADRKVTVATVEVEVGQRISQSA